MLTGMKDKRQ